MNMGGKNIKICLDTNIVAYFIEGNPTFGPKIKSFLREKKKKKDTVCVTFLTICELLVKPLQEHDDGLVDFYSGIDKNLGLNILYPNDRVAVVAARLRVMYSIATPDALNVAIAMENSCTVFLTNDRKLTKIKEIEVRML